MKIIRTTLSRMGSYYLLLAVNILPCASVIPDRFPARNLSTIYLLALSVGLVLYYAHRVSPAGRLSAMMRALSWMGLLLILLRGIKYSAFSEVGVLARHTWYCYYLPMLAIPQLLLNIALLLSRRENRRRSAALALTTLFTLALVLAVLTNDLHRQAFRFQAGFRDWDSSYTRGWLFYAAILWQYGLYLASIVLLVLRCRISGARKHAWLLLLPFAVGAAMNVLLLTGSMPKLNGTYIVEFPEALICMSAAVLEGCIQLGLIPTNANYGKLFSLFSISAQITDQGGRPVYVSRSASPLTGEQFAMPDGSRLDAHTVLHKQPLPGGFGFWQDDLTELDRLNAELAEAGEALRQEAELSRLRNELKERQAKLEQRTLVYDAISRRTRRQAALISALAKTGQTTPDLAEKEDCRNRIILLGAYIKRYANLTLLSWERGVIETGELALSVSELLRYLNFCGIPGELICTADCAVTATAALASFEALEALLEGNVPGLRGVFANLSAGAGESVTFKLTFENLTAALTAESAASLAAAGVCHKAQREEDVTYLCLTLPKGGEGV